MNKWQKVSTKRPCAICERTSWCLFDPLAGEALCTKIASTELFEGLYGWVHIVPPSPEEADESQEIHHYAAHTLSDEEAIARDQLYREMVRHPFMQLTAADREHLQAGSPSRRRHHRARGVLQLHGREWN
jgi:hypothetical protein